MTGSAYLLPVDSTTYRIYTAARVRQSGAIRRQRSTPGGKVWAEMTEQEHQDYPGDWEAQVGQGAITFHSEEHLGSSDRGLLMLRKMLRRQLKAIAEGRDPAGLARRPGEELITSTAGNWFGAA